MGIKIGTEGVYHHLDTMDSEVVLRSAQLPFAGPRADVIAGACAAASPSIPAISRREAHAATADGQRI